MTCRLFEHFSQIFLHTYIINTIETQQQQGLMLSEEALFSELNLERNMRSLA